MIDKLCSKILIANSQAKQECLLSVQEVAFQYPDKVSVCVHFLSRHRNQFILVAYFVLGFQMWYPNIPFLTCCTLVFLRVTINISTL